MNAFLYSIALQIKLDLRSKTLLITCYIVPLLFFALMGGIFTSLYPQMQDVLIQSMTVMGVCMGALIGLPPSILETYSGDVRRLYQANGVPLSLGLISMCISTFFHLLVMSAVIYALSPVLFNASVPENPLTYFICLAVFIASSIGVGCVLGLMMKNQAKLTMVSQLVFLPSIMLSGIMFPANLLPGFLEAIGKVFPATWGYNSMIGETLLTANLLPLAAILLLAITLVWLKLKGLRSE